MATYRVSASSEKEAKRKAKRTRLARHQGKAKSRAGVTA